MNQVCSKRLSLLANCAVITHHRHSFALNVTGFGIPKGIIPQILYTMRYSKLDLMTFQIWTYVNNFYRKTLFMLWSFCPSVCLSVTLVISVKTTKYIIKHEIPRKICHNHISYEALGQQSIIHRHCNLAISPSWSRIKDLFINFPNIARWGISSLYLRRWRRFEHYECFLVWTVVTESNDHSTSSKVAHLEQNGVG